MTLNLESGLLSRAEPLCGAIAPFTEVRFPNILHTAKANICSDILGCSKFPEMMHYCIGISRPAFRFNDSVLKQPKTLIIHYDPANYNKLLMVIKKDYDEKINQPFWHIEIETMPYITDNDKKKNVITTFLHGMYYINDDYFSHIDCTKNQYTIDSYRKKYNEEGDTAADLYTEDGYHYKLWCIEDGKYSREIWYELMIVSLPETYQKLLNEIINDEIDT